MSNACAQIRIVDDATISAVAGSHAATRTMDALASFAPPLSSVDRLIEATSRLAGIGFLGAGYGVVVYFLMR